MSRAERITIDRGAGAPQRLRTLAGQVAPLALAAARTLPLSPTVAPLLPSGLRRGSTVVVTSAPSRPQGAISLALALAARASASGSWCAAVGVPDLGLLAAAELGIDLDRMALVPDVPPAHWVSVVAALIDSVDILLARPPAHLKPGDARRLTTRTRERGVVLIPMLPGGSRGGPWAEGADVRFEVTEARWAGPGTGEGHLHGRRIVVTAGGRGAAARERVVGLDLPAFEENTAFEENVAFAGSDADLLPDRAGGIVRADRVVRADRADRADRAGRDRGPERSLEAG